jgi:hypothetical protein
MQYDCRPVGGFYMHGRREEVVILSAMIGYVLFTGKFRKIDLQNLVYARDKNIHL